ncbi:MAG: hypothetical protein ACR2OJ_08060 [Hyphomicrobiales bacterium]
MNQPEKTLCFICVFKGLNLPRFDLRITLPDTRLLAKPQVADTVDSLCHRYQASIEPIKDKPGPFQGKTHTHLPQPHKTAANSP